MGKLNNALRMLAILRSRKKVTRKELSEELEVSEREITRYKDDLEYAGVNINNKIKAAAKMEIEMEKESSCYSKGVTINSNIEEEKKKWLSINDGIINSKKIFIKYMDYIHIMEQTLLLVYAMIKMN